MAMAPKYLEQVLKEINRESSPPKALHAEHLFKLNEAVFNLNEDETVDSKTASRLFQVVGTITTAYQQGKFDNTDSNFFYDYLALLGTMQNQHFFSCKQTDKLLAWMRDVLDEGATPELSNSQKALKKAEAEIQRLTTRLAKYENDSKGSGAKGGNKKQKWEDDYYYDEWQEPASKKQSAKAGKGKGKWEEEPPAKSKKNEGKGKDAKADKGKGKGKGKASPEPSPKASPKGKGKGDKGKASPKGKATEKGKGTEKGKATEKGKGKGKEAAASPSPKAGKGKGKEEKGKGKGKAKEEESPKGKAKGKAKGKGKAAYEEEEKPPMRNKKAGKKSGGKGW
eukprot:TRINITY_DN3825_c0_g3_i1.p2 TRINITY_DN3825_c0_g3~~TRINITY_DN3825_c0_g3_i1.p2  ORF type:complete len:338 (-),score=128.58 TRINITY_DN3825_c0_g3_i1:168-1181(-)